MKYLIVMCLMMPALNVRAEFVSGNQLRGWIRESEKIDSGVRHDLLKAGQAMGYIQGVYDTLKSVTVCSPPGITVGQIERIVIKYFDENPEVWNISADRIVSAALSKAFPCKQ